MRQYHLRHIIWLESAENHVKPQATTYSTQLFQLLLELLRQMLTRRACRYCQNIPIGHVVRLGHVL